MKKNESALVTRNKKQSLWIWILLVCIVGVGGFLRLQGTFTHSFAFTYDVGRDMLALSDIVKPHKMPLIGFTTGLPGVFYGPWWYVILLIPYILSRGDPAGVAGFIALTGIATIIAAFILGKKIGNTWLGLLCALLVGISPALIGISSQIWNPNTAPLFVSLVFIILIRMYSQKNVSWKLAGMIGLLLGLMFDVEIVFGTLFFVGICITIVIFLRKYLRLLPVTVFLIGILFIFSPRTFFELRHHFLMTQAIYHTLFNNASHANVGSQVVGRMQFFLTLWVDSLSGQSVVVGVGMILFSAISTIFFFKKAQALEKMITAMLWIIVFVFILGLTFFSHDIWPHYTVGIPFVYALLFALSLYAWRNIKYAPYGIIFVAIVLFWLNVQPVRVLSDMRKPIFEGDASVYRNQVAVIDYVYHTAHGEKFKYIVYTPPVYDYTYQYLFQWYGKKT